LNNLELRQLKRLCDKYGIDYYEIDNTLTYWENKKHLLSIVRMLLAANDAWELERYAEQQHKYMDEHFLSYYVMCQLNGETKSDEVGKLIEPPHFSFQEWVSERHGRYNKTV